MRAIFIALGAALLAKFHWVIYIFGVLLVVTGIKMLRTGGSHDIHPERNPVYRLFRRFVPAVDSYRADRFIVREGGRWVATPLMAVLVAVEATDLVFAVDSIPAIFAVTSDPFIVYTSNIFAILGLRAMFFLLAGVMDKFEYLKVGLALVLTFVGTKMLLTEIYKIPIGASLGVVAALIAGSVIASLLKPSVRHPTPDRELPEAGPSRPEHP
jgi:tellurite resistance protein TerC